MHSRTIPLLALALLLAPAAAAQSPARLVVETNLPAARVLADGVYVGRAGDGVLAVPPGTRDVTLSADADGWGIEPVTAALGALPADSTYRIRLDFPYHYRVRTVPFGASVYLEKAGVRQSLGETPLLYRSEQPLDGTLVVQYPGLAEQRVVPRADLFSEVELVLQPPRSEASSAEVSWRPPGARQAWIDYVAVGLALAGGVTAIHYKFRADDLYDRYAETGDPSLRPRIKTLDTRAGVALGAMQLGVGVFAVRLALRR